MEIGDYMLWDIGLYNMETIDWFLAVLFLNWAKLIDRNNQT